MICNYRRYAREFPLMGTVLRTMAAERLPALVHCEHGKDRTGVLCAVLQRIAGCPEDDIMAAYLATNEANAETTAHETAQLSQGMSDDERAVLASFLEARPTYLRAFFDEVEGCVGGFPAYVRDALRLTPVGMHDFRASFREWFEKLPARLFLYARQIVHSAQSLPTASWGKAGRYGKRHGAMASRAAIAPSPRSRLDVMSVVALALRGSCRLALAPLAPSVAGSRSQGVPLFDGCAILSPRFSTVK